MTSEANNIAVVLLSGGMDSSAALYTIAKHFQFRNNYDEIHCLSFNYGQKHSVELQAAKDIVAVLADDQDNLLVNTHTILDIDLTQLGGSPLTDSDIETPEGMEQQAYTVVPARNSILLSYAAAYAGTLRRRNEDGTWDRTQQIDIVYGPNLEDYSSYPDCRPEFVRTMSKALSLSEEITRIITPLVNMNKAAIVKAGNELGVPWELTHTCYNGKPSCGECPACIERENGFASNAITDPLKRERLGVESKPVKKVDPIEATKTTEYSPDDEDVAAANVNEEADETETRAEGESTKCTHGMPIDKCNLCRSDTVAHPG